MFAIFEAEKIITVSMLALFSLSIFTRLLLGFLYQRMIREADNMATTKNKLLKQCKLKFANCFQLNDGVANIPVFVDKFLNRLALGPLSFDALYHLSGQMMLLSVAAAGVGICKSIIGGRMFGEILPFYIASFLGLYLYFSVSTLMDVKGKKRILKINLIDYLENHLSSRIHVTERDMEMLFGKNIQGRVRPSGQRGRRTVELMPIGSRLSAAESFPIPEEKRTASGIEVQEAVSEREKKEALFVLGEKEAVSAMERREAASAIKETGLLVDDIRRQVRRAAELTGKEDRKELFTKEQERELEELLKEFLTS
ncbi:MAG: hypothetical protein LBQ15_08955 [Clostridium sp.]|nr:hypothetical protein [Clostridium sp.]